MTTYERMPRMLAHQEADRVPITDSPWGASLNNGKHRGKEPEFLDFTIDGTEAWRAAQERIAPPHDRVDSERLQRESPQWRAEGRWIAAHLWFGFDATHSWMVGTEHVDDRLMFHGVLNATLFWEPEKLSAQMRVAIPVMKRNGGNMLSSDHSAPDSVS